ncbi:MAG: sigma-70 family RNA polymerase sigma factor [Prolixibacteraceae bacterium]|nr:sigma-70 family RNA polymerase sigma factor [Prolixibacteraceae bacterium]MBT6767236.1 sigma-70 family RNA polymerase sigma factor [Prolixibacteraceae bacterium]MBT6998794.1 sigma-70 family RNA polymerase sigma factor [Prolixibacteraceae bacterium]MBT7394952.1 sigma-70 family RNA polymerase sigma factor [Prolixibacteraceae bacterium]
MPGINKNEFIDLFNQMYKTIKNYIYYKTGDIDLADDIAQETFIKIWEKRNEIRLETIKSLLYKIAGNLCKNRFEHQQVVFDFANKFRQNEHAVSPEFELELKEFNEKLQNAIGGLTEKNRVVFLMNRIDGLTYKQIAENLEISIKAVEKRMKNALDILKKKIKYKI